MNEDPNERYAHGPDLGAVLGGLVVIAIAVAVAVHVVFDRSFDWQVYAAGILLLSGFAVVATSVAAAATDRRDDIDGSR